MAIFGRAIRRTEEVDSLAQEVGQLGAADRRETRCGHLGRQRQAIE
jgi:hypothetical protein